MNRKVNKKQDNESQTLPKISFRLEISTVTQYNTKYQYLMKEMVSFNNYQYQYCLNTWNWLNCNLDISAQRQLAIFISKISEADIAKFNKTISLGGRQYGWNYDIVSLRKYLFFFFNQVKRAIRWGYLKLPFWVCGRLQIIIHTCDAFRECLQITIPESVDGIASFTDRKNYIATTVTDLSSSGEKFSTNISQYLNPVMISI